MAQFKILNCCPTGHGPFTPMAINMDNIVYIAPHDENPDICGVFVRDQTTGMKLFYVQGSMANTIRGVKVAMA